MSHETNEISVHAGGVEKLYGIHILEFTKKGHDFQDHLWSAFVPPESCLHGGTEDETSLFEERLMESLQNDRYDIPGCMINETSESNRDEVNLNREYSRQIRNRHEGE